MESRVEESNACDLWKLSSTEADDFQSRKVVSSDQQFIREEPYSSRAEFHMFDLQRCKVLQLLEMVKSLVVDLHWLAIVPSVNDPVADEG